MTPGCRAKKALWPGRLVKTQSAVEMAKEGGVLRAFPVARDAFSAGQKKAQVFSLGFALRAWRFPTFAWQPATLSSALSGFTAEFGMGSGGSRSLWSPSKLVRPMRGIGPNGLKAALEAPGLQTVLEICNQGSQAGGSASRRRHAAPNTKRIGCYRVKPHGQLVRVSCMHCCTSTSRLSTLWSSTALQGTLSPGEISSWEGLPA
jgi:hypothetical protein